MLTVDIKSLLNRLTPHCTRALEGAAGLCVSRTHYEVTVEHLLAKLLEEPGGDLPLILRHFDIDTATVLRGLEQTIERLHTGNGGKPVFSPLLIQWFQDAWLISSIDLTDERIRSGALLAALLAKPLQLAEGKYVDTLRPIVRDALLKQFGGIVQGSVENSAPGERTTTREESAPVGTTALTKFCTDFTGKAEAGEIDPVFGRDREISQMIDILARRRKNNPIVVGDAGVGKTAVVEGLALRIVQGDVPDILRDVAILGLDMGLLQAGAGVKGEFENRLKSVISEIKASPRPIILFIDEAHTLIGAGAQAGGGDAANLLKPALARGELRTVAATTWSEYKKYFEKDAALARRFQPVKLDEPSVETAVLILRGLKETYEQAHGVVVRDDAIVAAAELSGRYISGRQLPDKAVDLLDTSAARVKILLTAKPSVIEDRERAIQALEREKKALERDHLHGAELEAERMPGIDDRLAALQAELGELTVRWQKEQGLAQQLVELRRELGVVAGEADAAARHKEIKAKIATLTIQLTKIQDGAPLVRIEVDPDVVAKVVSDWTGIPLGKVLRDQAGSAMQLENDLRRRIKGQDESIRIIGETVRAAKAGLNDPTRPQGIFLLVGPSGVGKTETAMAVADLLFGGDRFLTTINMSEFQEAHTVSRLIGSPPGYVGFGEGGLLTEAVRRQPYSVVLMDEVEKAHLDVVTLFYQVFDKGSLSDSEGRDIDFKNTVMFLTSNLASEQISQLCAGLDRPSPEALAEAIRPLLSRHFKPALLARMTIVPFYLLDPSFMKQIVTLRLNKLADRLMESHKMTFAYSDAVLECIAERCTEVETGARNIDHIMRGTILPQLSEKILMQMGSGDMPAAVRLDVAKGGDFSFAFEETVANVKPRKKSAARAAKSNFKL
ncbi:MAG: type VI secretion system ATPase TssH [Desulfuromonadaceae bacterium]|nr:type VI secretion system ATPase TssH [Desulfuromonadaceae bacterium]MDD2849177.1 type VI secretion system ATPase TssH [Desulfuromonadaceae bacterium]MDD4129774.1 type VI secretion system ATPase TssH [Desulfuromonadaceae bacterium]